MADLPPWRDEDAPDSEPCGPADVVNGLRQDCGLGAWDLGFLEGARQLGLVDALDGEMDTVVEAGLTGFGHGADWGIGWAFAIVGMAEAIRRNDHVKACPLCGKASQVRVWPTLNRSHPYPFGWVCRPCFDAQATDSPSNTFDTKEK